MLTWWDGTNALTEVLIVRPPLHWRDYRTIMFETGRFADLRLLLTLMLLRHYDGIVRRYRDGEIIIMMNGRVGVDDRCHPVANAGQRMVVATPESTKLTNHQQTAAR